jgi:hypothetical protein
MTIEKVLSSLPGLRSSEGFKPTDKSVGYCRPSLRDYGGGITASPGSIAGAAF